MCVCVCVSKRESDSECVCVCVFPSLKPDSESLDTTHAESEAEVQRWGSVWSDGEREGLTGASESLSLLNADTS